MSVNGVERAVTVKSFAALNSLVSLVSELVFVWLNGLMLALWALLMMQCSKNVRMKSVTKTPRTSMRRRLC